MLAVRFPARNDVTVAATYIARTKERPMSLVLIVVLVAANSSYFVEWIPN